MRTSNARSTPILSMNQASEKTKRRENIVKLNVQSNSVRKIHAAVVIVEKILVQNSLRKIVHIFVETDSLFRL